MMISFHLAFQPRTTTGTLKLYADAAAAARTEAAELRERLAAAEAELATLRAKAGTGSLCWKMWESNDRKVRNYMKLYN
jgi:ribosomal protein L29